MIGGVLIAVGPWPQRLDAKLIHHILMILDGGPIYRRRLAWHKARE